MFGYQTGSLTHTLKISCLYIFYSDFLLSFLYSLLKPYTWHSFFQTFLSLNLRPFWNLHFEQRRHLKVQIKHLPYHLAQTFFWFIIQKSLHDLWTFAFIGLPSKIHAFMYACVCMCMHAHMNTEFIWQLTEFLNSHVGCSYILYNRRLYYQ